MIWKSIKDKKSIILFLGLFTVLIVASYYLAEPGLKEYPAYRVNSPAKDGTKAFYQSLDELDIPVTMFQAHSNQLEASQSTALILFNPPELMTSDLIEGYQQFINQGGTVYLFTDQLTDVLGINPIPVYPVEEEGEVRVDDQLYQGLLTSRLRLSKEEADRILIEDDHGVIGLERLSGAGKIIQFVEPNWFSNQHILEYDHLHIMTEIIDFSAYNQLFFESYHYLDETSLTVLDVMPNPLIIFAIVIVVVSILIIWMQGKRFGPALSLREQTVRFGDERIRALANWQIRGRNFQAALNVEVDYLKYLIFDRMGIPITASSSDYKQGLQRLLTHLDSESIGRFIDQLEAVLDSEHVTKKEFLAWTKRIDQIRREVEAE